MPMCGIMLFVVVNGLFFFLELVAVAPPVGGTLSSLLCLALC